MLRLVLALAFTGAASATDVITVSGGSFTAPYYTFDGVDKWPDGTPKLEEFKTYRFEDGGVSSGHPFRMTGSLDAANPGASDFELPVDFTITSTAMAVGYYCAAHSSMSGSFMIEGSPSDDTNNEVSVDPDPSDDGGDGGGDDNEDHDHGSGYDEHDHGVVDGVEQKDNYCCRGYTKPKT